MALCVNMLGSAVKFRILRQAGGPLAVRIDPVCTFYQDDNRLWKQFEKCEGGKAMGCHRK